ncbi:DUF4349 domain-containing protein [Mycobacterium branderi]|uniref:DUF4349 domain-containing protein n=1 Tax=Mycobacterium branderi TaxID=43348 RepID=A0A7I7WEB0_9MYCO|nr:DUF4349 domain-containing protein [Mycobacterium branderi]MCV7236273.1 DUF4349 domain-containing protein [Mycobacterium branderi]ORA35448.1 hypothetical protein BST20_17815 [Mycobacterium branderi]BBZ15155.1 hypothetical protein MBRA_53500 [Mycobacterium branderi]
MVTNRKPAHLALLIGLATVLIAVLCGCAGNRPVSGAGDPAPAAPSSPSNQPQRDIVTTGNISITAADVGKAADRLADLTTGMGGRVDDRTERTASGRSGSADLTLRIPSQKVDEFVTSAKHLGTVTSISLKHEDVTSGRVDLDARIAALQTSVDRLNALMKNAGSTGDLLQAEEALSKRQADLDSLRAQRVQLGEQISYATIRVSVSSEFAPPAPGFVASVKRGWHALVSFSHGLVTLAGFLLPWLPVLLIIAAAVVLLRRRARRRSQASVGVQTAEPAWPDELES